MCISVYILLVCEIVRFQHECEGGIEKSVPRISDLPSDDKRRSLGTDFSTPSSHE